MEVREEHEVKVKGDRTEVEVEGTEKGLKLGVGRGLEEVG